MNLNKSELIKILEIINDCRYGETIDHFKNTAHKFQNLMQMENIIFLSAPVGYHINENLVREINISYPARWTKKYRLEKYFYIDPVIQCKKTGLIYWDEIYKKYSPKKEFFNSAKECGLNHGLTHILPSKHGFCLLSLADRKIRKDTRTRNIIESISPHLHFFASKVAVPAKGKPIKLTAREREVLLWVMEGKSNWEISKILLVSQESVKSHLKNILSKLEATTRAHAVAIALNANLIYMS